MREARGLEEIRRAARAPPIRSARPVLAGRATRSGAAEGIPRAIGLVKRIDATHAATAADGLPALIKGREVTVRSATSPAAAVMRAPRIQRITALLSARRQAGESDGQSNSCKKKRCAHVDLTFQSINEPFGPCQATKAFASGWKWRRPAVDRPLCFIGLHRPLPCHSHQHLAEILAPQHAEERCRRVLQPFDDMLAILDPASADPFAHVP